MKHNMGVIGGGYAGIAVAVGLAEQGHHVTLVESSPERFDTLASGSFSSADVLLVDAFQKVLAAGTLHLTKDIANLSDLFFVFVCVGTPADPRGRTDLSQLWLAAKEVEPYLAEHSCFIIKSTVPVGTGDLLQDWFKQLGREIEVISYPEFLREGSSLADFRAPARVILGGDMEKQGIHSLRKLLARYTLPIIVMTRRNAELAKYAANAFLATKISFINQIAGLCDELGADVQTVARAIGLDPRIGQAFLAAGIGYGGPCLPKDLNSLLHQGGALGVALPLLAAVKEVNEQQQEWVLRKVKVMCGSLKKKKLAIWGVSFKGGSEDIRDSVAVSIIQKLTQQNAVLSLYDPCGLQSLRQTWQQEKFCSENICWCQDPWEAVMGADALVILTDWQVFREMDLGRLKQGLKEPIVIDGRNLFPPKVMEDYGFQYVSVGRKI